MNDTQATMYEQPMNLLFDNGQPTVFTTLHDPRRDLLGADHSTKHQKSMTEKARITLPVSIGDLAIILEAMGVAWGNDILARQEDSYIVIFKP